MKLSALPAPIANFYTDDSARLRFDCFGGSYLISSIDNAALLCRKTQRTYLLLVALILGVYFPLVTSFVTFSSINETIRTIITWVTIGLTAFIISFGSNTVLLFWIWRERKRLSIENTEKSERNRTPIKAEDAGRLYPFLVKHAYKPLLFASLGLHVFFVVLSVGFAAFFAQSFLRNHEAIYVAPVPTEQYQLKTGWGKSVMKDVDKLDALGNEMRDSLREIDVMLSAWFIFAAMGAMGFTFSIVNDVYILKCAMGKGSLTLA